MVPSTGSTAVSATVFSTGFAPVSVISSAEYCLWRTSRERLLVDNFSPCGGLLVEDCSWGISAVASRTSLGTVLWDTLTEGFSPHRGLLVEDFLSCGVVGDCSWRMFVVASKTSPGTVLWGALIEDSSPLRGLLVKDFSSGEGLLVEDCSWRISAVALKPLQGTVMWGALTEDFSPCRTLLVEDLSSGGGPLTWWRTAHRGCLLIYWRPHWEPSCGVSESMAGDPA